MSRLSRVLWYAWTVIALGVLLSAGSATAQVLLYVPAEGSSQLWEYGITMASGNPFNLPAQPSNGIQPNTVAVSPNNKFLYVGASDGTIDAYLVNTDGTLASAGPPFANAGGVRGLGIDPTGKFLYASDNPGATIQVFSINQTTGALTELPAFTTALPAGAQPRGMAIDASGHLYVAFAALNQVGQYSINTTNGQLTLAAAPVATGTTPDRVAVTPSGQFVYVTNFFGESISVYSASGSGALTAVGSPVSTGSPSRPFGVTVHPGGSYLLVTLNSTNAINNVIVYSIGGSGTLTQVATGATTGSTGALASGVTVEPGGQYVYVSNQGNGTVTKFNISSAGALSGTFNFATGATPGFLLARLAPTAGGGGGGGTPPIPTLSTWSFVLLGLLLAGSSALLYRRAYR